MIDLYQAVTDYRHRCEVLPITHYPRVWAGHYDSGMVGECGLPAFPDVDRAEARIGFALLIPFAYARDAVSTSFLIYDDSNRRELLITRLAVLVRGGVLTTSWVIPYLIGDFQTELGEARQEPFNVPFLGNALEMITTERLGKRQSETFEDAMAVSLHQMESLTVTP